VPNEFDQLRMGTQFHLAASILGKGCTIYESFSLSWIRCYFNWYCMASVLNRLITRLEKLKDKSIGCCLSI